MWLVVHHASSSLDWPRPLEAGHEHRVALSATTPQGTYHICRSGIIGRAATRVEALKTAELALLSLTCLRLARLPAVLSSQSSGTLTATSNHRLCSSCRTVCMLPFEAPSSNHRPRTRYNILYSTQTSRGRTFSHAMPHYLSPLCSGSPLWGVARWPAAGSTSQIPRGPPHLLIP